MVQAQANATTIQVLIQRETLNLRAIDRIIQSNEFVESWKQSSVERRQKLLEVLGNKDLTGVRLWMASGPKKLPDMSYRELRDLAQRHSIPKYSRLDKEQLLRALSKRGINDDSVTPGHQSTT